MDNEDEAFKAQKGRHKVFPDRYHEIYRLLDGKYLGIDQLESR
jgi:hypothetical protein